MVRYALRAAGSRSTVILLIALLLTVGFAQWSAPVEAERAVPFSSRYAMSSPNGLVINEIYDSQTGTNEYFELYNTTNVSIDLSTYVIYNRDTAIPLSRLVNPLITGGQFRAIGSSQLGSTWFAGATGLERTDFLGLVNTSPGDTIIDVVNWGGAPNPNWPNYDRFANEFFNANIPLMPPADGTRSLQRWPDGLDSDTGSDFAQIFSSPSNPSCGDPFEDNNTSGTAREQAVGTASLHRLCPAGDQDWTSISMSSSNNYQLFAQAQGNQIDLTIRLYDASGVQVAENNDPASRNASITFRPTSSGIYRLQVVEATGAGGNGSGYLYSLAITAQAVASATPVSPTPGTSATPTAIPCQDIYEPDNTRDGARPIELNTSQRHSLCPAGDNDWVTFVATPDKVYTMETLNLTASVDTVITLFDSQGRFLFENDDYQPGQGLQSRIDYSFDRTGVYYLRIRDSRGSGGVGYEYTVRLSSVGALPPTGTPTRTPTFNPNSPTPTTAPCRDSYESDGIPADAKTILIGTVQKHSICPSADADWVKFYARAGKVYTIRTANLGVGLDTYMYVFDSDGSRILAQNDDGGEGVASRIDFFPLRDDWYFAQVKNAGDIGGPEQTYDLALTVVPGVPQQPVTPSPIIAPPVTVTTGPPQPTSVVQATRPPVPTPTQGQQQPTPAQPPPPVQTGQPQLPPPPVQTGQAQPPGPPVESEPTPTVMVPNIPNTGAQGKGVNSPANLPLTGNPQTGSFLSPYSIRIFYDKNADGKWVVSEGVRGAHVYFIRHDGTQGAAMVSSEAGKCSTLLPLDTYRLVVPYFGLDLPAGENSRLKLQPVLLPERVP